MNELKNGPYVAIFSGLNGKAVRLSYQLPNVSRSNSTEFNRVQVYATHNYNNVKLNSLERNDNKGYISIHKNELGFLTDSYLYLVTPIFIIENKEEITKYLHTRLNIPGESSVELEGLSMIADSEKFNVGELKKKGSQTKGYIFY